MADGALEEEKRTRRYFYFPKNDNLRSVLEKNLSHLWPTARDMLAIKDYSREFVLKEEVVEFIALAGEDIASNSKKVGMLFMANPRDLAITGSDLLLENILDRI
jgi:hypothetical protein